MKAILTIVSILFVSAMLIGPLTLMGCKDSGSKPAVFGQHTSAKAAFKNASSNVKTDVCPKCGQKYH